MTNGNIARRMGDSSPLLDFLVKQNLLKTDRLSDEYRQAKLNAWNDPLIVDVVDQLRQWPGSVLKRHNDAKLLIHKLAFLADLGFSLENKEISFITDAILKHKSPEGVYQIQVNIPRQFGGSGEDQFSWMLCDAPLLMYSLLKMGVDREILNPGIQYLISLGTKLGYPCAASSDLGRFNGPGKRGTLCPYADLLMVKLFTLLPEKHNDELCRTAVEALLNHTDQREKHYLFGAGTNSEN